MSALTPTACDREACGDHFRDRGEFREREEFRGARAEFRDHDRGWHRGWDRDRGERTVIIKRRHHNWD